MSPETMIPSTFNPMPGAMYGEPNTTVPETSISTQLHGTKFQLKLRSIWRLTALSGVYLAIVTRLISLVRFNIEGFLGIIVLVYHDMPFASQHAKGLNCFAFTWC